MVKPDPDGQPRNITRVFQVWPGKIDHSVELHASDIEMLMPDRIIEWVPKTELQVCLGKSSCEHVTSRYSSLGAGFTSRQRELQPPPLSSTPPLPRQNGPGSQQTCKTSSCSMSLTTPSLQHSSQPWYRKSDPKTPSPQSQRAANLLARRRNRGRRRRLSIPRLSLQPISMVVAGAAVVEQGRENIQRVTTPPEA